MYTVYSYFLWFEKENFQTICLGKKGHNNLDKQKYVVLENLYLKIQIVSQVRERVRVAIADQRI